MVNVGKYTNPMDGMGYLSNQAVTFLSAIVGGHLTNLWKGHLT